MHDSGFKRWVVLGALASASWWMAACGGLPQQPGNESYSPGFVRNPAQSGINGTIQQIPTSIDPRTPEKDGTRGRTLLMDPGAQALREAQQAQQAQGGSGLDQPLMRGEPKPEERGGGRQGSPESMSAPVRERPVTKSTGAGGYSGQSGTSGGTSTGGQGQRNDR